jgi:hypothetical protein
MNFAIEKASSSFEEAFFIPLRYAIHISQKRKIKKQNHYRFAFFRRKFGFEIPAAFGIC